MPRWFNACMHDKVSNFDRTQGHSHIYDISNFIHTRYCTEREYIWAFTYACGRILGPPLVPVRTYLVAAPFIS